MMLRTWKLIVDAVLEKLVNEGLGAAGNYVSQIRENKIRNGSRIDRHLFNELWDTLEG